MKSVLKILVLVYLMSSFSSLTNQLKAGPFSTGSQKSEKTSLNNQNTFQKNYSPMYWVEGVGERGRGISTDSAASAILESVYAKGWRGITFWGADRDGAN